MHADTRNWNVRVQNYSTLKDDDEQPTLKETANCPDSMKHASTGLRLGYPLITDNWLPSLTENFRLEVLGTS